MLPDNKAPEESVDVYSQFPERETYALEYVSRARLQDYKDISEKTISELNVDIPDEALREMIARDKEYDDTTSEEELKRAVGSIYFSKADAVYRTLESVANEASTDIANLHEAEAHLNHKKQTIPEYLNQDANLWSFFDWFKYAALLTTSLVIVYIFYIFALTNFQSNATALLFAEEGEAANVKIAILMFMACGAGLKIASIKILRSWNRWIFKSIFFCSIVLLVTSVFSYAFVMLDAQSFFSTDTTAGFSGMFDDDVADSTTESVLVNFLLILTISVMFLEFCLSYMLSHVVITAFQGQKRENPDYVRITRQIENIRKYVVELTQYKSRLEGYCTAEAKRAMELQVLTQNNVRLWYLKKLRLEEVKKERIKLIEANLPNF